MQGIGVGLVVEGRAAEVVGSMAVERAVLKDRGRGIEVDC